MKNKKITPLMFLAVLVVIGWALIGFERLTGINLTSGTSSSQEPISTQELTIEELAAKEDAVVGIPEKSYFLPPSGGWAYIEALQRSAITIDEKRIENVITIEIYSDEDAFIQFMDDQAYFAIYNKFGESNYDFDVYSWRRRETGGFYVVLMCKADCSDAAYVLMGGLDPDRHPGKSKIIFEITR